MYGSRCLDQCDPGMTIVNGTICQVCDPSCLTCSIANFSYCLSCYSGQYLSNGQCGISCPNGTFKNTTTFKCDACQSPCANCQSISYC